MRNLGELMLYIESIDFKDKADLKRQLEKNMRERGVNVGDSRDRS